MRFSKYRAKRVELDGCKFASRAEAARYLELMQWFDARRIGQFSMQVKYKFACGASYIADFRYYDNQRKRFVIEDVKGFKTAIYRLKKKMLKQEYKIEVEEIRMPSKAVNLLLAAKGVK